MIIIVKCYCFTIKHIAWVISMDCSQNLPESMTDSCPSILMVRTNPPRLKDISRRSVLQSSDVLKITPLGSIVLNLKSFKTLKLL